MVFFVLALVLMFICTPMMLMLLPVALMALRLVARTERCLAVVARAAGLPLVHRSHAHGRGALLGLKQLGVAVVADVPLLRMLRA